MARWDLAEWVGPTPNKVVGGMSEYRGLVVHIMQGTYVGSIAWGKNPASQVSFHFATRADGHIGQLVDTADTAWTQGNGNGHWLSVENEGFSGNPLTAGQVEAVAQIYARGVRDYGWAYQLADGTSGRGLGWHGMGGQAWGGHPDCPGAPIVAQRQQILDRARQINEGGTPPQREDDDMSVKLIAPDQGWGKGGVYKLFPTDLGMALEALAGELGVAVQLWGQEVHVANALLLGRPIEDIRAEWKAMGGTGAAGPSLDQIRTVVDQELDEQSRAGADQD